MSKMSMHALGGLDVEGVDRAHLDVEAHRLGSAAQRGGVADGDAVVVGRPGLVGEGLRR